MAAINVAKHFGKQKLQIRLLKQLVDFEERKSGPKTAALSSALVMLADSFQSSNFTEAESLYRRAIAIDLDTYGERDPRTMTAMADLADTLSSSLGSKETINIYKRLLVLHTSLGSSYYGKTLDDHFKIAEEEESAGDYAASEMHYRIALEGRMATFGQDSLDVALTEAGLAEALSDQGQFLEANHLFVKALAGERIRGAATSFKLPAIYTEYAQSLYDQDRFKEAEFYYRRALDVSGGLKGDNQVDLSGGYNNLGLVMISEKRYDEALMLLRKSISIERKVDTHNPDIAFVYANAARCLGKTGRYREAITYVRMAEELDEASSNTIELVKTYHLHALILKDAGDLEGAGKIDDKALYLLENSTNAEPLTQRLEGSLANVVPRRKSNYFDFLYYDSIDLKWLIHQQSTSTGGIGEGAFKVAQALLDTKAAQTMLAVEARTSLSQGPLSDAIRKEQDLTGEIDATNAEVVTKYSNSDTKAVKSLRAMLTDLLNRREGVDATIDHDFPSYRAFISPHALSVAEVQAALKPEQGLLLILRANKAIYSFAIGKATFAWHRSDKSAEATIENVKRLRCQVDASYCENDVSISTMTAFQRLGYPAYDLDASYQLYRELIIPVESALTKSRQIYVTTSPAFADLPLGMLTMTSVAPNQDDADPAVLSRAKWLGDKYALDYLPTIAGLKFRSDSLHRSSVPFVGYGDPQLKGGADADCSRSVHPFRQDGESAERSGLADPTMLRKLCPLPATGRELVSMARVLGTDDGRVHRLSAATETAVKTDEALRSAEVIAFATHGAAAGTGRPFGFEEAGLVLTPPASPTVLDDGVLTASEAAQLSLSADWVILSACDTATAGQGDDDTLSALAKGFLYAGAQALLASHWSVSDEATAALTTEVLKYRQNHPGVSHAEALQAAMKSVRTGFSDDGTRVQGWQTGWAHPTYWAPFTNITDHE